MKPRRWVHSRLYRAGGKSDFSARESEAPPEPVRDGKRLGRSLALPKVERRHRWLKRQEKRHQIVLLGFAELQFENQIEKLDCVREGQQPAVMQVRG
jgi:hypothetical protein